MNVHVLHERDLTFSAVDASDVDLRPGGEHQRALVADARRRLAEPGRTDEHAAWTAIAVLGSARMGEAYEPEPAPLAALVDWLGEDLARPLMFWFLLYKIAPGVMGSLAMAMLRTRPEAVGVPYAASLMAKGDVRAELQRRVATHPLDGVREYYFALLGKHRRLVPPGSISSEEFAPEVLAEVLHAGITDTVPAVRERALAAAFGRNVVAMVRDDVLRCLDDDVMDVRQYAIVALGILDDPASLACIVDKLEHGSQPEVASAISALARRPDGLARVLALASDDRPWVRRHLLGALANVSAPMTDEQIATLSRIVIHDDLPAIIDRHLERTRRGGPEHGPDGNWFVVRAASPDEPPAPGS